MPVRTARPGFSIGTHRLRALSCTVENGWPDEARAWIKSRGPTRSCISTDRRGPACPSCPGERWTSIRCSPARNQEMFRVVAWRLELPTLADVTKLQRIGQGMGRALPDLGKLA